MVAYLPNGTYGWLTPAEVRGLWADAPYDDEMLEMIVDAAAIQLDAFVPLYPVVQATAAWKLAHLMQIKNLWNAGKTDPAGTYGEEGFAFRPYPLDWQIKALIRPKSAVPVVA